MLEMIAIVIVSAAVLLLWVSLYDTHHFTITTHTIRSEKIKQKKRYVMLSDMHGQQYGRDNEVLLRAICEQQPDGILIAGDMLTALKKEKTKMLEKFLRQLKEKYPVYYANGNHEQKIDLYPERYGDLKERFGEALKQAEIEPLINTRVDLPECGIAVYGAQIDRGFYKRFQQPDMPEDYMEKLLGKPESDRYTVLLAHNPDYFPSYAAWGADLVLSGHVHGGIMRLPFLGGVISPAIKIFPKYDGGVYREGKSTMILGRGIGTHSPNVRFFNPGELVVIDLCPEA